MGPPDLHAWLGSFNSLEVLNDFTWQVVVSRRDTGVRKWTDWLREDSLSRPYAWLRPDFVQWSPFLVVREINSNSRMSASIR